MLAHHLHHLSNIQPALHQRPVLATSFARKRAFYDSQHNDRGRPTYTKNTRLWTNVAQMLAHYVRCWPKIDPTLAERIVLIVTAKGAFYIAEWCKCSIHYKLHPADTIPSPDAVSLLANHLRRWHNSKAALGKCLVCAGWPLTPPCLNGNMVRLKLGMTGFCPKTTTSPSTSDSKNTFATPEENKWQILSYSNNLNWGGGDCQFFKKCNIFRHLRLEIVLGIK